MHDLSNALFEMQYRVKSMEAEVEHHRLAKLAAASRPRKERMFGVRRMAVRLGDLVAGLRCRLESRWASEPAATPC